jgi:hypothetical protein
MEESLYGEKKSPKWAFKFLAWFCPAAQYEIIEGDLIEQFELDVREVGEKKARRRLIWNSLNFFRPRILLERKLKLNWFSRVADSVNAYKLNFDKSNNLVGFVVFGIALLTYLLTVEETASFWDCSEFIASSYKLEVPHPPGAPLFLLLGRFFSFFAFGDNTKVAYAINTLSAIASAFTILFLYWSIVLFGRKLIRSPKNGELSEHKKWLLLISGMVGSLAYAFSDSFWFSAVEAEVYAMSSFSTALVVWCILKWDMEKDESRANRWVILIAYIIGLSIGVHLLNLLTLPALALVYYFKKFKTTKAGVALALTIGGALIIFINDLIVPGLPTLAGRFELFFVNTLGLFFGSGAIAFSLLFISMLIIAIRYSQRKRLVAVNTFLLAFTFILVGLASYTAVVIRSNYNTPINEDAPKDVMSFVSYLKREQYVSPPLLFGPYFTANPVGIKYGPPHYIKGKDKYEIGERKYRLEYNREDETILPRAWSPDFKEDYQSIMGLRAGQRPTFAQNIYYMLKHQIGAMYVRYLMWNFAGRDGDEQGADWLRPTEWFKTLPQALASNKARNNYFMIPFLLGLLGLCYQFLNDRKNFLVLGLLFSMLGVAIVVFLNSPPTEPRERDYIYVGSYYAYAFWIGLGVIAIADILDRFLKNKKTLLILTSMIGMMVPVVMVIQGWDDHDRSNRFFSVDSSTNTLNSCDPDGILFTGGDNDTFPLWYAQETENCHDDLRVLVLSYCNTDWYVDQTSRKVNRSKPFARTLNAKAYQQGGPNDYLSYADLKINSIDAKQYLDLLSKNHPGLRDGDRNIVPSKVITIDIDKRAVIEKGVIPKGMENLVVSRMELRLTNNVIEKRDLLFLDLLVTSNWERPVYLNPTSMSQMNIDLKPYAVQEGNVYRILPVKNPRTDRDYLVNTEKSYDLMVNKFRYRGLNDPGIYYTNDYAIQVMNHRSNLNSLAEALIDKGETEKAANVLLFSLNKMPDSAIPYDPSSPDTVNLLFKVGKKQKAIEVAKVIANRAGEVASFLIANDSRTSYELRKNIFLLGAMQRSLYEHGEQELARTYGVSYNSLMASFRGDDHTEAAN